MPAIQHPSKINEGRKPTTFVLYSKETGLPEIFNHKVDVREAMNTGRYTSEPPEAKDAAPAAVEAAPVAEEKKPKVARAKPISRKAPAKASEPVEDGEDDLDIGGDNA